MTGPPIKSVAAQKGHILRVNWASGSVTLLNMRPVFQSPRFAAVQDKAVWRSVVTDGRTISWTDAEGYTYDMAEYEVNRFADGL